MQEKASDCYVTEKRTVFKTKKRFKGYMFYFLVISAIIFEQTCLLTFL